MNNNDKKVRTSKRNFILALALLLLTNIMMGVTLMAMCKKTLSEQIEQRMLDIANSASAMLNGDDLSSISSTDRDTEIYQTAYDILHKFKDSIELEYIYAIAPKNDGTFTFSIDPDEEDPGEYGDIIEATPALVNAYNGTADVDDVPHADEWGRFYSAYSPFFDSEGNVVGIVGVDFDADWYDEMHSSHRAAAIILLMVALTIGIVLSFIIMSKNRKKFAGMLNNLAELDLETQKLDNIIMQSSIKKLDMLPENESRVLKTLAAGEDEKKVSVNEYDEMNTSIKSVYNKLHKYLKYIDAEVYTDDTTGVLNKAAYKNKIKKLDDDISAGEANFSVAFFDINELKKTYTNYGYEAGDKLMFELAKILKVVFGKESVYHITGDEFVVLAEGKSRFDMEDDFTSLDEKLKDYNKGNKRDEWLTVAKGSATFNKEKFSNYRQTFISAKSECDKDKEEYYKNAHR